MIENIKRFVNEHHHTLIVVVIGVLVICFIYWWFCCKDSVPKNKVRGGTAVTKVCYLGPNEIPFKCLGLEIYSIFFVLNEEGRKEVENVNDLFKIYTSYVNHYIICNFEGDCLSLPNLIKKPYHFFKKFARSGSAIINLIPNERLSKKNPNPKRRGEHITRMKYFNFETCLECAEDTVKEAIVGSYMKLYSFVNKYFHIYFDNVNFIGQPSISASGDGSDGNELGIQTKISPNVKGNLGGNLYFSINNFLRDWYSLENAQIMQTFRTRAWIEGELTEECDTRETARIKPTHVPSVKFDIKTADVDDEEGVYWNKYPVNNDLCEFEVGIANGKIGDKSARVRRKWEVADIYPAHKLLEMIFFLFGLMEQYIAMEVNERGENARNAAEEEYFRMMASYIICVNLFNAYCGIQMDSEWNNKIGNLYVYNYGDPWKNITSGPIMKPFSKALIESSILKTMGKELSTLDVNNERNMDGFWNALSAEAKDACIRVYSSDMINKLKRKENDIVTGEESGLEVVVNTTDEELKNIIKGLLLKKEDFVAYLLELKETIRNEQHSNVRERLNEFRESCKKIWSELCELPESPPESQETNKSGFENVDLIAADQAWEEEKAEIMEKSESVEHSLNQPLNVNARSNKKKVRDTTNISGFNKFIVSQRIAILMSYSEIDMGDSSYITTCNELLNKYKTDPAVRNTIDNIKPPKNPAEINALNELARDLMANL